MIIDKFIYNKMQCMKLAKIETYRTIVQHIRFARIKKNINNKWLMKHRVNIFISGSGVVGTAVAALIQSGHPIQQLQKSFTLDECLIGIGHRHPMYYLYKSDFTICQDCWTVISQFAEKVCLKMGKKEYKQRKSKLLLFRKSLVCEYIDRDIIKYIYHIMMYKI